MSEAALVPIMVVATEGEAAMICGYLESQGIEASYDSGGMSQTFSPGGLGTAFGGHQEIRVRAEDVEAARAALDARPD